MKAWEVLAVAHDGELICFDCMTEEEREVAEGIRVHDDITPLFAIKAHENEVCGRCRLIIIGTESD